MNSFYITADSIGSSTGGGIVTYHESVAMKDFDPRCFVMDRMFLISKNILLPKTSGFGLKVENGEPWCWDYRAKYGRDWFVVCPRLVHFYAGTFSATVQEVKRQGAKVTYTAAAHDINISRREHESIGIPYDYKHLTDPNLLVCYLGGYLNADVLIVPSKHSEHVMRNFGATNRIEIIPHGVNIPDHFTNPPSNFVVGYLGAVGPDKGLRYLLEAWKLLDYKVQDGILRIAGSQSQSEFVKWMINCVFGHIPDTIELVGWVDKVSDFYNGISLYVQPSVTEGFGCEVLEAMAHGRTVLCSTGAGSCDVVKDLFHFQPANAQDIAECIDSERRQELNNKGHFTIVGLHNREVARQYTWDKIRKRYQDVWRSLV